MNYKKDRAVCAVPSRALCKRRGLFSCLFSFLFRSPRSSGLVPLVGEFGRRPSSGGAIVVFASLRRSILFLSITGNGRLGRRVFAMRGSGIGRSHQALLAVADQILASCFLQGLTYQVSVLRSIVLQQCPLQLLFVVVGCHVNGLHGQRVDAGVIHHRGRRSWCGVIILHLFGGISVFLQAER